MASIPRDDIVASAVRFLSDPKVKSASLAKQISFLETKGLTADEIQKAINQAKINEADNTSSDLVSSSQTLSTQASGQPAASVLPSHENRYNNNRISPQQHLHELPPIPPRPKYDWRDLFIATVVAGGLGYGLYELAKTYVFPMFNGSANNKLEQAQQQLCESISENNSKLENLAETLEKALNSMTETNLTIVSTLERIEKVSERLLDESTERELNSKILLETVTELKTSSLINSYSSKSDNGVTTSDIQSEIRSLKALLLSKRVPPSATPSSLTSSLLSPSVTNLIGTGSNMTSVTDQKSSHFDDQSTSGTLQDLNDDQSLSRPKSSLSAASTHSSIIEDTTPKITAPESPVSTIPSWQLK
ncbi:hypothetical protein BB561_002949 [Smittium simulii]|uniref:Peroxisomal membrane protein PEX14 n=1 Tax=Smittium simulii TaxID=133385 RepID=A0A2T9YNL6_9FUNG|nr:hypothetical protein BB561_002949 [Smittium simulii]